MFDFTALPFWVEIHAMSHREATQIWSWWHAHANYCAWYCDQIERQATSQTEVAWFRSRAINARRLAWGMEGAAV